ncbi:MAG TPA: hypothetical protein VER33_19980 [Polyangiaceae bacterium]|nr:hypothetical protein [Polyangiaceae bacterium]
MRRALHIHAERTWKGAVVLGLAVWSNVVASCSQNVPDGNVAASRGGQDGAGSGNAEGGENAAGDGGAGAGGGNSAPREVGEACISPEERNPQFSGFSSEETNIAAVADSEVLVCLYNRFHGRVSCPYGQTPEEIASLPSDSPRRCRVPDAAGNATVAPVTVPVDPQFVYRSADKAAHYSCRCDGPAPGDYCRCPSSMVCVELVEDFPGPEPSPFAGSYCVKRGYDRDAPLGATCDASSTDPATDCGNDRANP